MVLGLAAGIGIPMLLKATGLDKQIESGLKSGVKATRKQLGFKKGGYVRKTGKALVHKGEYVIPKHQVDKMKKAAKIKAPPKSKPKAKKKK